jgi:hypothetical protein
MSPFPLTVSVGYNTVFQGAPPPPVIRNGSAVCFRGVVGTIICFSASCRVCTLVVRSFTELEVRFTIIGNRNSLNHLGFHHSVGSVYALEGLSILRHTTVFKILG